MQGSNSWPWDQALSQRLSRHQGTPLTLCDRPLGVHHLRLEQRFSHNMTATFSHTFLCILLVPRDERKNMEFVRASSEHKKNRKLSEVYRHCFLKKVGKHMLVFTWLLIVSEWRLWFKHWGVKYTFLKWKNEFDAVKNLQTERRRGRYFSPFFLPS